MHQEDSHSWGKNSTKRFSIEMMDLYYKLSSLKATINVVIVAQN